MPRYKNNGADHHLADKRDDKGVLTKRGEVIRKGEEFDDEDQDLQIKFPNKFEKLSSGTRGGPATIPRVLNVDGGRVEQNPERLVPEVGSPPPTGDPANEHPAGKFEGEEKLDPKKNLPGTGEHGELNQRAATDKTTDDDGEGGDEKKTARGTGPGKGAKDVTKDFDAADEADVKVSKDKDGGYWVLDDGDPVNEKALTTKTAVNKAIADYVKK